MMQEKENHDIYRCTGHKFDFSVDPGEDSVDWENVKSIFNFLCYGLIIANIMIIYEITYSALKSCLNGMNN